MSIKLKFNFARLKIQTGFQNFLRSQYRFFYSVFMGVGVLLVLFFSLSYRLTVLPESMQTVRRLIDKQVVMGSRLKKIEQGSKKGLLYHQMENLFLRVSNFEEKKKYEFVTRFQGFEGIKGHEAKLILAEPIQKTLFKQTKILTASPFREIEYELINPLVLNDRELRYLILELETLREKYPGILVTEFSFNKQSIENEEKFVVALSFVFREKTGVNF